MTKCRAPRSASALPFPGRPWAGGEALPVEAALAVNERAVEQGWGLSQVCGMHLERAVGAEDHTTVWKGALGGAEVAAADDLGDDVDGHTLLTDAVQHR